MYAPPGLCWLLDWTCCRHFFDSCQQLCFSFPVPVSNGEAAEDPIVKLELNYGKVGRIAVDMRLPE